MDTEAQPGVVLTAVAKAQECTEQEELVQDQWRGAEEDQPRLGHQLDLWTGSEFTLTVIGTTKESAAAHF